MLISLVRRVTMCDDNPNKPNDATIMANAAKNPNTLPNILSDLYCWLKYSSIKKKSNIKSKDYKEI